MHTILMPKSGQTMEEGAVLRWLKKESELVQAGEVIVEIETDKAVAEVQSAAAGVLRKILVAEGEKVPVLTALAYVGGPQEELPSEATKSESKRVEIKPPSPAATTESTRGPERIAKLVSPRARRLATTQGVDLNSLAGSGPEGRITEDDVKNFLSNRKHDTSGSPQLSRDQYSSGKQPGVTRTQVPYEKEKLTWIYRHMTLIREFDERVQQLFLAGKIIGAVHVYCGEEAVAVGVCAQLLSGDYITGTHRSHGHCLAKGIEPKALMAELYGKATGICRGKGGSMHIAAPELGMLGANGIVAAGLPIACGAALSAKLRKSGQVAVAFFGDGASNAGGFHEALNLAAALGLPVVFVLENNGFADTTRISYAACIENLSERAKAYGFPGVTVDGSDVLAVFDAVGAAVTKAREDNTPTLLECKTFRYYGHFVGDTASYRTPEELEEYRKKDCILQFEKKVLAEGWLDRAALDHIRRQSVRFVDDAVTFAESSPDPRPQDVVNDVYASY